MSEEKLDPPEMYPVVNASVSSIIGLDASRYFPEDLPILRESITDDSSANSDMRKFLPARKRKLRKAKQHAQKKARKITKQHR